MKKYCPSIMLLVLCFTISFGKIKNGYAPGVDHAKESLKCLQAIVHGLATNAQRRTIDARIKSLINYIIYYEFTESLLGQFKSIAPAIYYDIDSIKDRRGRPVDVYVKFIPQEQAGVQAWGITNVAQVTDDHDMSSSEYGNGTVSVKIWIVPKALIVLAHELGHVKVQIPNLAEYIAYYKATYRPCVTEPNLIGHDSSDASGQSADIFTKYFKAKYAERLRKRDGHTDFPLVLLEVIRKQVRDTLLIDKTITTL